MKSIGEQAKDFRLAKKWNTTLMAREVGTTRQSIENLDRRVGRDKTCEPDATGRRLICK